MSTGADRKANTLGGGALERGHDAALEQLEQLGDARCSVGAAAVTIDAAELVVGQTAKGKGGVSMGADTRANTRGGGALERGHGALLERLAQLGDALVGVGTLVITINIFVEAAELVCRQTASTGMGSVNGR